MPWTGDGQGLKCPPHPDGRCSDGNNCFETVLHWRLSDSFSDILLYFFPFFFLTFKTF